MEKFMGEFAMIGGHLRRITRTSWNGPNLRSRPTARSSVPVRDNPPRATKLWRTVTRAVPVGRGNDERKTWPEGDRWRACWVLARRCYPGYGAVRWLRRRSRAQIAPDAWQASALVVVR